MSTPICSLCGSALEVISDLNRVEGQLVCWTCLVPNPNERWKVTVRWAGDLPTAKEVGQLRALVPAFQETPSRELWESFKDKSEVFAGEFYRPHLEQIISRNKKYELKLRIQNTLDDHADKPAFERLILAIQRNDAGQVAQIASQAPNIDALTDNGTDLLSYSIDTGNKEAADALMASGIDLANPHSTYTAMQTALENGAYNIIDTLLERKADLNCKGTEEDAYAIHVLCQNYRSSDLLSRFLDNGADPHVVDDGGNTALMILQASLEHEGYDAETHAMIEALERATEARQPGRLRGLLKWSWRKKTPSQR